MNEWINEWNLPGENKKKKIQPSLSEIKQGKVEISSYYLFIGGNDFFFASVSEIYHGEIMSFSDLLPTRAIHSVLVPHSPKNALQHHYVF